MPSTHGLASRATRTTTTARPTASTTTASARTRRTCRAGIDAVKAADAVVDFCEYAINGEVPEPLRGVRRHRRRVERRPDLIWSHSWDLSEGTGLRRLADVDGVKINNYAMMPEVGGDLTGFTGRRSAARSRPPSASTPTSTATCWACPTSTTTATSREGTDIYSLMAGGSWNRYPERLAIFSGNSPAASGRLEQVPPGLRHPDRGHRHHQRRRCRRRRRTRSSTRWSCPTRAARSTSCSRTASRSGSTRA